MPERLSLPSAIEGFESSRDFPYPGEVRTAFMICSTPRSGSTLLAGHMEATGTMGVPIEYFHPKLLPHWKELAGGADPTAAVRYIQSRRTSSNGCFGFKAHFHQFTGLTREVDFPRVFPDCRLILMDRRDVLGQAISLVRANQTGQWTSRDPVKAPPHYDYRAIRRALFLVLTERASWQHYLACSGRPFLAVTYEDLVRDPEAELLRVAECLGVDRCAAPPRPQAPVFSRQSGHESDDWRARFLQEAPSLRASARPEAALVVQNGPLPALLRAILPQR